MFRAASRGVPKRVTRIMPRLPGTNIDKSDAARLQQKSQAQEAQKLRQYGYDWYHDGTKGFFEHHGKAKAGASNDNFRARRLSVSDIDTSEFEKANPMSSPQPAAGGRQRRMSMSPEMGVVKPKSTLPFVLDFVGTYSCHGVEPGMRAGETSAKINQDRGCVCHPFGENPAYTQSLFCVYDGHGALGDKVSHFVMNEVQAQLEAHPSLESAPEKALKDVFVAVDEKLRKDKSIDAELSGTTAVAVLYRVYHENKAKVHLWSACAGDSRAVMGSLKDGKEVAFDLTEDQKPDTPAEHARIKKAGGFVSPPEEEWGGPARVWLDANMTLPGLAMARSLGDHLVSSVGVMAEPEVTYTTWDTPETEAEDGPWFIVIASDGVWEFIESQQAVSLVGKFIKQQGDSTVAVTKLIETAAAKWRQEEGDYRDDITAIVIRVRKLYDQPSPDQA